MTKKIYMTVPDDLIEKIDQYASKLGVTRNMFMRMALLAGSKAVLRAVSPEDAFTPEQWSKIFQISAKDEDKNGTVD